jgi:hypothetical protein
MFGSRGSRTESVTCIACDADLKRSDAREYDKHGDRWNRDGKEFEFLCKPCYQELCHQPRKGLEDRLVDIGAGSCDQETFLSAFVADDRARSKARESDEK